MSNALEKTGEDGLVRMVIKNRVAFSEFYGDKTPTNL